MSAKDIFNIKDLVDFYKNYISFEQFPKLRKFTSRTLSLFSTTYLCEQLFSLMKLSKASKRSMLSDTHFKNTLRLTLSIAYTTEYSRHIKKTPFQK